MIEPSTMILPYVHPTTVLFVDDSKLFVRDLGLHLPPGVAVEAMEDPRAALQRINRDPGIPSLAERRVIWGLQNPNEVDCRTEFDLAMVEDELHCAGRFRRVSVVVVDYGMPAMSGLEFANEIRDASVQKILITGVADHRLAVSAFNNHDIQRFFPKGDSSLFRRLWVSIRDLQHAHFAEKRNDLELALGMKLPKYASASVVIEYYASLCQQLGIVEHYMVREPAGLLMVNSVGTVHRLLVLDESQLTDQARLAESSGAPANVVDVLRSRKKAVSLDYALWATCSESRSWDEYLVDLERLADAQNWYVGLGSDPQSTTRLLKTDASFSAFLDEVDQYALAELGAEHSRR